MTERIFRVKVRNYGSAAYDGSTHEYLIVADSITEVPKKARNVSKRKRRNMLRVISIEDLGERDA